MSTADSPFPRVPPPVTFCADPWDEAEIPPRPWIAPGYLMRGSVTLLVGPPGSMKSLLATVWACALALGREHGDFSPAISGPVLIYNVEDDEFEQRRRLSAALRQFDATPEDIRDKIVRAHPESLGALFSFEPDLREVLPTPAMDSLRQALPKLAPIALFADPLVELHNAPENDNTALRAVIAEFRSLAQEFDLSVVLPHHTRKGAIVPGDIDGARGASSVIGAARIAFTLTTMPEADAALFGLPADREKQVELRPH